MSKTASPAQAGKRGGKAPRPAKASATASVNPLADKEEGELSSDGEYCPEFEPDVGAATGRHARNEHH